MDKVWVNATIFSSIIANWEYSLKIVVARAQKYRTIAETAKHCRKNLFKSSSYMGVGGEDAGRYVTSVQDI